MSRMTAEPVLSALREPDDSGRDITGIAVTDQMIVAVGRAADRSPIVLASSDARHFEPRATPRDGLCAALAVGDSLWACGEHGLLAVSRDHGGRWQALEAGTTSCLRALALGGDGAIWVVGDAGYAARVLGEKPRQVDVGAALRLSGVHAVRDAIVMLGSDGALLRWRDGELAAVACGTDRRLTALAVTARGTWVVIGEGGFVARSPDGAWYSRVATGVDVDLEAICALPDGSLAIVGDRGCVLTSTDDARSWRAAAGIELGAAHLWTIARFGGGALIGGGRGVIARLAVPGDATWSERANVFGQAFDPTRALDEVFVAGPEGFIARGLAAYLDALGLTDDAGHGGHRGNGNGGARANGDGEDEDDELDDDVADLGIDDPEALALLGEVGDADAFRANYGVPLPIEVSRLFELARDRDRASFTELRLDADLRPDVGEHNLFELVVRRNQQAYLGSDLVEAFCGVFAIGSQDSGDTYHLEIHPWDGHRQVLHFDCENAAFSGVCADSLDSLVYLAALVKVGEDGAVSGDVYAEGLRRLHGKVAPTWQFAIDDKADEFVVLEPRRRDTEFFFYRSRWICALLRNDGVTALDDIRSLFDPALNQVIAADQLASRFEACNRFIPTALYAMWRSYLFDEPELARYLEIGRQHAARLVRDAARLIDELRAGRNQLGTIGNVRAWLASFRALDLDPRGAPERRAASERRAAADAARRAERAAELDRTPRERWAALAWQWLDDGAAHRALLARLGGTQRAQIAAIDELRDAGEDERAVALPRIAAELSSELEAVLVGSLVRDDALDGEALDAVAEAVLGEDHRERVRSGGNGNGNGHDRDHRDDEDDDDDRGDEDDDDQDDDDQDDDDQDDDDDQHRGDDERPSGWDAIDRALAPVYAGVEPLHYGTMTSYGFGGDDPIPGISVYPRDDPDPHWHFVTYGFTELFRKESADPRASGYGFELTLRLARAVDDAQPPNWALNFLQNLARYVFSTGNAFAAGHKMGLNGPIALDHATKITAVCFTDDPELGDIDSEFGKARFLQIVGITDDEYRVIQEWSTGGLIDILQHRIPYLLTDLARSSVLDDPATAEIVRERIDREGSSEDLTFAGELLLSAEGGQIVIELGALYAATLPRAMRGRIRHRREYELHGRAATLRIVPSDIPGYRLDSNDLVLEMTQELAAEIEAALRNAMAGTYRFESWPRLTIVVTPSIIRGQDGSATDVRGVTDPDEVRRILEQDRARRAAGEPAEDDDEGDSPHRDVAGADDAAETIDRPRDVTVYAGELLAARARAGALDRRVAATLRPLLDVGQKYEHRRISVVSVLGALRDRDSVPAMIRILESTRIASALDAVGKEELLTATANALEAIADPAAIPALSKLVAAPGRYNDEPRAAAASALAACVDAAPARPPLDGTLFDAMARAIGHAEDDEYLAEMHLAYAALARTLPSPARAAAQRLLDLDVELDPGGVAMLARRVALALCGDDAGPDADTTAALRARLHASLRDPGFDHDAAIRNLRIVLRIAARLPALADGADLVWLTRLAEPDIRARAHELLAAAGRPLARAAAFDRRKARGVSDRELVRWISETHVVGRAALVAEAGRRKLASARPAIIRAAHAVIDHARPAGQDLLDPEARLLETAVSALLDGPLDDDTIALFDRMLRHDNHRVKWELLQSPPRDKRLIGGMIHVLGEGWGWQETAAKQWLASYTQTDHHVEEDEDEVDTADATGDDDVDDDDDDPGDDDGRVN
jgi:suppressor of fused